MSSLAQSEHISTFYRYLPPTDPETVLEEPSACLNAPNSSPTNAPNFYKPPSTASAPLGGHQFERPNSGMKTKPHLFLRNRNVAQAPSQPPECLNCAAVQRCSARRCENSSDVQITIIRERADKVYQVERVFLSPAVESCFRRFWRGKCSKVHSEAADGLQKLKAAATSQTSSLNKLSERSGRIDGQTDVTPGGHRRAGANPTSYRMDRSIPTRFGGKCTDLLLWGRSTVIRWIVGSWLAFRNS